MAMKNDEDLPALLYFQQIVVLFIQEENPRKCLKCHLELSYFDIYHISLIKALSDNHPSTARD